MPSAIPSVENSKDLIAVPLYVPIDIPYRAPSVVPINFPSDNPKDVISENKLEITQ